MKLLFVETKQFTRRISAEGWEEDLRELQQELLSNPEKGPVEQGVLTDEQKKVLRPLIDAFKHER